MSLFKFKFLTQNHSDQAKTRVGNKKGQIADWAGKSEEADFVAEECNQAQVSLLFAYEQGEEVLTALTELDLA